MRRLTSTAAPSYSTPRMSTSISTRRRSTCDKHQPDDAIEEAVGAIVLDPKDARLTTTWASLCMISSKWTRRYRSTALAIELDPKLAKAHSNLGVAL